MALLDLSLVTKTLLRVVTESINASAARPPGTITFTSLPPHLLTGDNSVGLYMYHLAEDAAHRNQPWAGRPLQPIRFSPMGLNLMYVLSTRSELAEELGPYREQLLMGLALKALHDHPIIDDATEVAGALVMQAPGDENRFRISLRNVPAAEAISYWTAGSNPLRLSAYYEVSVTLLEPDEPERGGGRVLTYGIETFLGGLPRLSASRNTITFTIPTETTPRSIEVQPAQAAIGDEITLLGSGLGGGALSVAVRGPGWPAPIELDPGWGVTSSGDRAFATVQDHAGAEWIFPGTYTAAATVVRTSTLTNGTTHVTRLPSNETPFQIVPRVAAVSAVSSTGVFTVTGGLFAHPTDAAKSPFVRVSAASESLAEGTAGALLAAEFAVVSASQLEIRLPGGLSSGTPVPFRIVINGSESPPRWVTAP